MAMGGRYRGCRGGDGCWSVIMEVEDEVVLMEDNAEVVDD